MAPPSRWASASLPLLAWLVFALAFALHYGLHSPWLDDYDSVQFALGMERLDLRVHQPHPPGYAAYIYMARALDLAVNDRQTSLVLLSAAGGAASVALTFLLGARLWSQAAGGLAALILLFVPLHFQQSVVAMTDVVVIPFFLGTLLCLEAAVRRADGRGTLAVAGAGLLMGWGVGVRPQWVFVFSAAALAYVVGTRHARRTAVLGATGLGATLAWLIPISVAHGGLLAYVALARRQYDAHPSDRANFTLEEIGAFVEWIPHRWEASLALLGAVAVVSTIVLAVRGRRETGPDRTGGGVRPLHAAGLVALWLLLAAAASLLFHPLRLPRSAVPLYPPLALLLGATTASGLRALPGAWTRTLATASIVAALWMMASTCIEQGRALRRTVPPAVQGARFIEQHFNPATTILRGRRNYRHWQHYAPGFEFGIETEEEPFDVTRAFGSYRRVVTDFPLFNVEPTRVVSYERSPDVYFDLPAVTLYQYDRERVMLTLLEGHYTMESLGFWTSERLTGWVQGGAGDLAIRWRSFDRPRQAIVRIAGTTAWTGTVPAENTSIRLGLDDPRGWQALEIESPEGCDRAAEAGQADSRCLSFFLSGLQVVDDALELGAPLDFSLSGAGYARMLRGWSVLEPEGAWTDGRAAALRVRLRSRPPGDLELRIDGHWFVRDGQPPLEVELAVNGTPIDRRTVSYGAHEDPVYTIPTSVIGEDARLELEFRFANPASPADFGEPDERTLGLFIRSLRLVSVPARRDAA